MLQVKEALEQQYNQDKRPPLSEAAAYIQNNMTLDGYRHLIALGELAAEMPGACVLSPG